MNRMLLFTAAVLLSLGAAGWTGWHFRGVSDQAALDAAKVAAQAQAAETARVLAVAEQERRALSQQLEDQANADPVTTTAALPRARVVRLNARITAANSAVPKP